MPNVFEIVLYVLVTVVLFYFVYAFIGFYMSNNQLRSQLKQAEIGRDHFKNKLLEQISIKESKKLEQTEGFFRFISQSRDWAFTYIEDVQKAIQELNEFWVTTNQDAIYLSSEETEELSKIISKLIAELPKDN